MVGWVGDEMDIRAGLTYVKEAGCIIGCIDGPIAVKNIDQVKEENILKNLAQRVMMIHITLVNGKADVPFMYFLTAKLTAKIMFDKVCIYH